MRERHPTVVIAAQENFASFGELPVAFVPVPEYGGRAATPVHHVGEIIYNDSRQTERVQLDRIRNKWCGVYQGDRQLPRTPGRSSQNLHMS